MFSLQRVSFLSVCLFLVVAGISESSNAGQPAFLRQEPIYVPSKDSSYTVRQCWNPGGYKPIDLNYWWVVNNPTFSGFSTTGNGQGSYVNDGGIQDRGNFEWWGGSNGSNDAVTALSCEKGDNRWWMGVWRKTDKNNGPYWEQNDDRNLKINSTGDYWRQNIRVPPSSSIYYVQSNWSSCRWHSTNSEMTVPQIWNQPDTTTPLDIPSTSQDAPETANGYQVTKSSLRPSSGGCRTDAGDPRWDKMKGTKFIWSPKAPADIREDEIEEYLESVEESGVPRVALSSNIFWREVASNGSLSGLQRDQQQALANPARVLRVGLLCAQRADCAEKLQEAQKSTKWQNRTGQYALLGNILFEVGDEIDPSVTGYSFNGGATGAENKPAFSQGSGGSLSIWATDQGGGLQNVVIGNNQISRGDWPRGNRFPLSNVIPPRQAFSDGYVGGQSELFTDLPTAVSPGSWEGNPESFQFQWQRCINQVCVDISGATSPVYTPTPSDLGWLLRARVTAIRGVSRESAFSGLASVLRFNPNQHMYTGNRESHLIGDPRVGQTLTLYSPWSGDDRDIYACPTVSSYGFNGEDGCRPAGRTTGGLYRIPASVQGSWLRVGNTTTLPFPQINAAGSNNAENQFSSYDPSYPDVGGIGEEPPPADVGILPAYSKTMTLCNRAASVVEELPRFLDYFPAWPVEVSTKTNPCPRSNGNTMPLQNSADSEDLGEPSLRHNLLEEGRNTLSATVYDFCTRDSLLACTSRNRTSTLPEIIWDNAAPSLSDPEDVNPNGHERREVINGREYWINNGMRCKAPDGENNWNVTPPDCTFQAVDKFLACEGLFPWGSTGCFENNLVALKALTWWDGDIREGFSKQNDNPTEPNILVNGLRDGRPQISAWAKDRVNNTSEMTKYENFVKIDTANPVAPRIIDGPGETPPSAYLDEWQEDPAPPDETNDTVRSSTSNPDPSDLASGRDCPLCWTVDGLEIAGGEEPSPEQVAAGEFPFDYDHPARLQCQLVYSGTGRTPAGQFADWKAPGWDTKKLWFADETEPDLTTSPIGTGVSVLGGAEIIKDTNFDGNGTWDCLDPDPRGQNTDSTETIAPFDLAGLLDGHYMFRVRQKDRSGRISPWSGRPLVLDTTAPETGALSRAQVYDIPDSFDGSEEEARSSTRQWQFDWGWDLLQTGQSAAPPSNETLRSRLSRPRVEAGIYCFVRNVSTAEIVRRSGWGCNASTFLGPTRGVETPMPWPGVRGEGAGTLAGLPDGSYEVGFLQRDRLGHTTEWAASPTIPFIKDGESIGVVSSPTINLQTRLDAQSVTSRRTEAELQLEVVGDHLAAGQAFFPVDGWISHYTPQELYSDCQVMTDNYSEYFGEGWEQEYKTVQQDPSSTNCPLDSTSYDSGKADEFNGPTEVRYSGGLALDEFSPGVDAKRGTFILDIFWMQPTQQNDIEARLLGDTDD